MTSMGWTVPNPRRFAEEEEVNAASFPEPTDGGHAHILTSLSSLLFSFLSLH